MEGKKKEGSEEETLPVKWQIFGEEGGKATNLPTLSCSGNRIGERGQRQAWEGRWAWGTPRQARGRQQHNGTNVWGVAGAREQLSVCNVPALWGGQVGVRQGKGHLVRQAGRGKAGGEGQAHMFTGKTQAGRHWVGAGGKGARGTAKGHAWDNHMSCLPGRQAATATGKGKAAARQGVVVSSPCPVLSCSCPCCLLQVGWGWAEVLGAGMPVQWE